jgi:hypothetical protein
MDFATWVKIYTDLGIGMFFATLYVGTLIAFWKDIQKQREIQNQLLERAIQSQDASTAATQNAAETMRQLKVSIDENKLHTTEFMAYLRGRQGGGQG